MVVPYQVIVRKANNVTVNKDITNYVVSLDKATDTDVATGEIGSASLMLRSDFGEFQTEASSGNTPLLDEFDELKIILTDDNNGTFSKIYEIDTILPQKVEQGNLLQLELLARERNLQLVHISGLFFAKNTFDMVSEIFARYNSTIGTRQPQIINYDNTAYNQVPKTTINTYDFTTETTCFDGLITVLDMLGASIGAGGAGDFFSVTFEDNSSNEDQLIVRIFSAGSTPATPVTITDALSTPVFEILGTKEAKSGTNVLVKGQENTGFLPVEFSKFIGRQEAFRLIQQYDSTQVYKQDMHAKVGTITYKAKQDVPINTTPPNTTYWDVITEGDFIGNIQYSPYTQDKATLWKNFGANPSAAFAPTSLASPAFADSNLVIRENTTSGKGTWRDWALLRAKNPSDIPSQYKYSGTGNAQFYDGLRVLVDSTLGTLGGTFAGNDPNGTAFANRIAIYENNNWFVFDPLGHGLQDWDQCAIRSEGKLYEYGRPFTGTAPGQSRRGITTGTKQWRDISGTAFGNDCFHRPKNIQNVAGLVRKILKSGSTTQRYTDNSAIKITYEISPFTTPLTKILGPIGSLGASILSMMATPAFYNYGWWANFAVPYPESTYNSITESVGQLYGGSNSTGAVKVPFLNLYNVDHASDGKTGYNHPKCTELLQLNGLAFYFKFEIKNASDALLAFKGDIPFRVTIYDNESNVWVQDFTYRIHGDTQFVPLFFSGFNLYRARTPWGLNTLINNIIVPELEIREIFEKRKVKLITIQMQDSYDEVGRYYPVKLQNLIFDLLQSGGTVKMEGTIDVWSFIKQPLARSQTSTITTRNIEPRFLHQTGVSNYYQLESLAQAQLDVEQHRYEAYTIQTNGFTNIKPGQSFVLKDANIISTSDISGNSNTRKLVARKISYPVNTKSSRGGFIRELEGVKKIE